MQKIKGDAYVYMDNLTVHDAGPVKDQFNERVQQRFLPTYTCSLNPIERVWHLTKHRWRRLMVQNPELI